MRRYDFLATEDIYEALNQLRNALLAAKNGEEVNQILEGLFTQDEKMKIGRRILIAEYLKNGFTLEEIINVLNVGKNTIMSVSKNMEIYPMCFELIESRAKKVESEYSKRKYKNTGGSKLIVKRKEYTGFKRKDIAR